MINQNETEAEWSTLRRARSIVFMGDAVEIRLSLANRAAADDTPWQESLGSPALPRRP
jgi:hypothetical protein